MIRNELLVDFFVIYGDGKVIYQTILPLVTAFVAALTYLRPQPYVGVRAVELGWGAVPEKP